MLKMSVRPLAIRNSSMPNSTPLRVEIRMSSSTGFSAALHECPDSEVRIISRHPRLRTSELKDTRNLCYLVWLGFRSPHDELAARMMRTSEPPHEDIQNQTARLCGPGGRGLSLDD